MPVLLLVQQHGHKVRVLTRPQGVRRTWLVQAQRNAGQAGYYRTLYSPAALGALRGAFAALAPIDQLGLLGDNFALAYAGYQPMGAALDLLAAVPHDANQKLLGDAAGRYAALYTMFDGQPAVQKQLAASGTAALGAARKSTRLKHSNSCASRMPSSD